MSQEYYIHVIQNNTTKFYIAPTLTKARTFMNKIQKETYNNLKDLFKNVIAKKYCVIELYPDTLIKWMNDFRNLQINYEGTLDNGITFVNFETLEHYIDYRDIKISKIGIVSFNLLISDACKIGSKLKINECIIDHKAYNLKLLSEMIKKSDVSYEDLKKIFNYNESFKLIKPIRL